MNIGAVLLSFLPLLLMAALIFFEVRLSRRAGKWPGLILPALVFCDSLRRAAAVVMQMHGAEASQIAAHSASTFFGANCVTLVLVGIYIVQRQKKKRRAQLEKMSVQDLG